MQIRKINGIYFPERAKIDKTQLILDRSGPVLKSCKIPTALLNYKLLHFSVYHSQKLCIYTENLEILTKISDSMAKKLSLCNILQPYNSEVSNNGKNTDFCKLVRGAHLMLDLGFVMIIASKRLLLSVNRFISMPLSFLLHKISPMILDRRKAV